MIGKILGAGAIRGEDGARYYYDEGEVKNLKDGQRLEGCEVDFDIKDGKAVAIYITSDSKVESIASQTNQNHSNEVISKELNIGNTKGFIFKGRVSNCETKSLGSLGHSASKLVGNRLATSGISLELLFTYFDMGNKSFMWLGNNPLSNGDEVVLYANRSLNGYYPVVNLKNITKGLFFGVGGNFLFRLIVISCLSALLGYLSFIMLDWHIKDWIASLLFMVCIVCGFYAFNRIKHKGIKLLFGALFIFYIMPIIFLLITTGQIYANPYAYHKSKEIWTFVGGVAVGFLAVLLAVAIRTRIIWEKTINKAVKEYE